MMQSKNIQAFIKDFLTEDKNTKNCDGSNPKLIWSMYYRAMQELKELERLAKIGKAIDESYKQEGAKYIEIRNADGEAVAYFENMEELIEFADNLLDCAEER